MRLFAAILLLFTLATPALAGQDEFMVLNYHDVRDDVAGVDGDAYAVSSADLTAQFSWMREHGYQPVTIDDILQARHGKKPLPDKAVLLTFDDGYVSFYTTVFPLLQLFGYPAVVAVVGEWMEGRPEDTVAYGDATLPREAFLSWEQIREMQRSGLVEVASHTFGMHRGIPANPYGNELPAATTARYDPARGSYEPAQAYRKRLAADLKKSARQIKHHTGRWPRALVWPYGSYNGVALDVAANAGFNVSFTLAGGVNRASEPGPWRRILMHGNPRLAELVYDLRHPRERPPVRVAHVDLDYIYDPDPKVQEANLGLLLERIKSLGVSVVYLQAFADPDGDGGADAVYFPNRHLPVRADLFGRAAWQLKTRTGVAVYAWMPVLSFFPPGDAWQRRTVLSQKDGETGISGAIYRRLSPFDPEVQELIGDLYEDLARHAAFDGLLFHDDARLTDLEDAHPAALKQYRNWGLPPSVEAIRADPRLAGRWSLLKTEYLADFIDLLTERVRAYRGAIKTTRNLYAPVVLEPASEAWFAQSLPVFLDRYDYTAVMAMPYMEGAQKPKEWLHTLIERVAAHPGALSRTVFELQSIDWRSGKPVPEKALTAWMNLLKAGGVRHFGYYPDDFPSGWPSEKAIRLGLSLHTVPGGR